MDPIRKTYVQFSHPGSFFAETESIEVASREPSEIKVPDGAFAFKFYDVLVATAEADGETYELRSKSFNYSGVYYYGGRVFTIDEIVAEGLDSGNLVSNLRGYDTDKGIRTRHGNWQPFCEGKDVHIPIEEPAATE